MTIVNAPTPQYAVTVDFTGTAEYSVTAVPDLVAERSMAGTEVQLNVRNNGAPEVRYYKATEVLSNFTALIDVGPASDYDHEDTAVDADVDYKYKAAFVSAGTRNGNPYEVVGQRSASVYVIADTSTL